jgi:HSP20 family protein
MPNLMPQKTSEKPNVATTRTPPAVYGEFPFFLSRMREEFDRILDRFAHAWPSGPEYAGHVWRWELDLRDEKDAVIVRAEAPGFEANDFDLQVTEDRLVLRATKKQETKGKEGKTQEYQEQEYYQSVTLPPGVDKDRVEAKYHNGVLTVTIPKTAEGKGRKITVTNA